MQPFLNTQFVEYERERRGETVPKHDPDGFLYDEHPLVPDPLGKVFIRLVDGVGNLVGLLLKRSPGDSCEPATNDKIFVQRTGTGSPGSDETVLHHRWRRSEVQTPGESG